jgi:CBS domain-containing protein
MTIRDIVERKHRIVETIRPVETVKSAADRMHAKKIAALVVMEFGVLRGIISERDIIRALSEHGESLLSKPVGEVMTKDVITIRLDESVKQAMRLMTRYRTRHLLALNDGALAGVVSIGDAVKHRLEDLELEAHVLRDAYIAAH